MGLLDFLRRDRDKTVYRKPRPSWENTEELLWHTLKEGNGYKKQVLVEKWVDMNSEALEWRRVSVGYDDGYYYYSNPIERTVRSDVSDTYRDTPIRTSRWTDGDAVAPNAESGGA